jgi:membrane-bound lytic murein transglycosylase D
MDGDTAREVARFFSVSLDELRRWNNLDPSAALQSGMILQLFVPPSVDLARAVVLAPDTVRVLVVGSEEFFAWHESQRGRVRLRYRVRAGDTLTTIGRRFDLSVDSIARINGFAADTTLQIDQEIVVYVPRESLPSGVDEGDVVEAPAPSPSAAPEAPAPVPPAPAPAAAEPPAGDESTRLPTNVSSSTSD